MRDLLIENSWKQAWNWFLVYDWLRGLTAGIITTLENFSSYWDGIEEALFATEPVLMSWDNDINE